MTRSQKTIISILSITACALLLALGYYIYQGYQSFAAQPLGPALPFTQQTMPPTWTASPASASTPAGLVTLAPTVTYATNTPSPMCGGANIMNILVVGADTRGDNYAYGLADAIRILRVDFVTPKVSVLEFPRDLWVEIPHIEDNLAGQDHEKLNQAYLYGQPGFKYWDDPSGGAGLLTLTLNLNFGVQIDHYIAVNMRTFVNIVNAVGGIDVHIPDKETARASNLSIGDHYLDGSEALKVVRNREGGTFERANNQNIVLCGLRKRLTSPAIVTQIPALIESFKDNVITDFTPEQLAQLACLGTKLPPQNIVFASFPIELFNQTREYDPVFEKRISILDADFNIMRDYVMRFQNGSWPEPSTELPTKDDEESTVICG
ncbi:MAG: LCP family protein [Anaerolineales bacterium]|nr:LCP family protein [Anaerolineales bacterium]